MSRATGYVRYNDGTVAYFIYNGTTDTCIPRIFDTPEKAWTAYRNDATWDEIWAVGGTDDESVTLATDYGGGFHWSGRATRKVITEGIEPLEWISFDGLPEWAVYTKESS